MKKLLLLLFSVAVVAAASGQNRNLTTLVMNFDVGNGIIAGAGPSRVRVPPGEFVTMIGPTAGVTSYQWNKNGTPIPGATQASLGLGSVTARDSGEYTLTAVGMPIQMYSTGIRLEVVPAGTTGNFSARLLLQPGPDTQIVGFVIAGRTTKSMLIRTVGPTLASFAVNNPATQPRMTVFNAKGEALNQIRVAVVLPPDYWTGLFTSAGAFALTGGEQAFLSYDLFALPPGVYSVHVTDASAKGGTVLVEAYELP